MQNKQPLKILLIFPTNRISLRPPLGLGYLGAIAKNKGCNVKIISKHTLYNRFSDKDIYNLARKFNPDIIGMMVFDEFSPLPAIYNLTKKLSELNAPIIAGGPHATTAPHELLENNFDIIVMGEGETTFSELIDHYNNSTPDLKNIKGIYYKDKGNKIQQTAPREPIHNLDKLPFPAKELYDKKCYPDTSQFGNILTSRGCPGQCTYCSQSVFGRRFRFRSAENIFEEIYKTYKKFNCDFFVIEDDAFTINKKLINEVCDLIIKNKLKIIWCCQTRIDAVTKELLEKMKKAGCNYVIYGLESGDPETLQRIKKHINTEKVKEVIKLTSDCGIKCYVNFMYGFPWETTKHLDNTFNLIKQISPYITEFSAGGVLIPHPDTEIYKTYKSKYGFDKWWLKKNYTTDHNNKLYNIMGYFSIGIIENNFFNYPPDVKKKIIEILTYIRKHNLKNKPFLERLFSTFFVETSILLCKINPKLDRILLMPIFRSIVFLAQIHKKHKKHYASL